MADNSARERPIMTPPGGFPGSAPPGLLPQTGPTGRLGHDFHFTLPDFKDELAGVPEVDSAVTQALEALKLALEMVTEAVEDLDRAVRAIGNPEGTPTPRQVPECETIPYSDGFGHQHGPS